MRRWQRILACLVVLFVWGTILHATHHTHRVTYPTITTIGGTP